MDVLITVLMKTPIYMGSLIMKDKENKDLLSSLFLLSVYLFLSSFFITRYQHDFILLISLSYKDPSISNKFYIFSCLNYWSKYLSFSE